MPRRLAHWQPWPSQSQTDESLYEFGRRKWGAGEVWRALESLPAASRVAWLGEGPYDVPYYPLFGRHYQLVPHPVGGDGGPVGRLHEAWLRDRSGTRWWWTSEAPNLDHLVDNLKVSGAQYVVVANKLKDPWPPQQAVLSASPDMQLLVIGERTALWQIHPAASPEDASSP